MFTKNRSTRTLTSTSEINETALDNKTGIPSAGNVDASWLPPPLFQAYPQSIKHVNLEASTLSAQSIIRMNEQRGTTLIHDSDENTMGIPAGSASATSQTRRVSASIADAEWTRKVYVLTTSGRLLQYAGKGPFDRKPEKILQLGQDSAAFASDAIEGRHFVLHVSQSCSDDGQPDLHSTKGIFSRMGMKAASARRSAKVLLMVFENPDDLESWLFVIRKMIGSLGGRPYSPEIFIVDPKPAPQHELSQRYLVRKDPAQFRREAGLSESKDTAAEDRPSTQSSAYTVTDLERLRDSKTSNLSLVTGTPTSLPDSPPSSSGEEKFALTDVPRLELPDMGSPSLVDFFRYGKPPSRLSVMFADITRFKAVDVNPPSSLVQQESLHARLVVKAKPVVPEVAQGQEEDLEETYGEMQEQEQEEMLEESDDQGAQTSGRPVSTIAPLPTYFSPRHTAPELSTSHRYSRLFPTTSESSPMLPKRYSSLEYSRCFRQSNLLHTTSSRPASPPKDLRRPASMQLRRQPISMAQMPTRSPSLRSSGQENAKSAENVHKTDSAARLSMNQPQTTVILPFGPPAGPPPSCPLPAVPTNALPTPRQSLGSRETKLSECWGEEPLDFF